MSRYRIRQQIRFVKKLFTLYGGMWNLFAEPDTIPGFKIFYGVFGGGTRLAMRKIILRAGLIVIEAWFRG